jgi:AcrR family transcriptional regulator
MVLQSAGVSSGSLYHHFADFPDLVNHALVAKYAQFADLQIAGMQHALDNSSTARDYEANLHALIGSTHAAGNGPMRVQRALIVAQGAVRDGMRQLLTVEQNRLTDGLAAIIGQAQANGWVQPGLDPRVLATFVQAYSVGRVVDDVADPGVDSDHWVAFIRHMISRATLTV